MRIVVALLLLIALPGSNKVEECDTLRSGRVECHIREMPAPGSTSGSGVTRTTISVDDIIYWPQLVYRADVGYCVTTVREVVPNGAHSSRAREAETRFIEMIGEYDMCPGVTRPRRSPAATAREVIEEFLPAAAQPYIAPGYAITGKPAYLETRSDLHPPTETRPTALGEITVTFTGRYVVDWGDGVVDTYTIEGTAWPNGEITHIYTHRGKYDIVVTTEWTAEWGIGDTTGRIDDGLQRTARIEDFDVRELEAVRNQ